MIPRVLHLIWLGPAPDSAFKHAATWFRCFPRIEFWDLARVRADPAIAWTLDTPWARGAAAAGHWPAVKDPVRIAILATYGGLYADMDIRWIRAPWDEPWWPQQPFQAVAGFEDARWLCNAVIGSLPAAPAMMWLLRAYETLDFAQMQNECSGPCMLTKAFQACPETALAVPPEVFYPLDWKTRRIRITPATVCVHEFDQSA